MSDLKVTEEIREQEENEAALNPESEVEAAAEAQTATPIPMDPAALQQRFIQEGVQVRCSV